ncbi:SWIM zinc finger family protein [Streptomyces tendae]|uniref:SWIM zinc finger family protein n=1 Tax=Streptomyces tendae TaxID=1932 RepID=UPI003722070F
MTPRPADEARRALREARGRGEPTSEDGERGATSPPRSPSSSAPSLPPAPAEARGEGASGRTPGEPTPSRPGDIARAALRSARAVPGEPVAPDASTDRADPTGSDDPGPGGEPTASGEQTGRTDDTTEPGSPDGASLTGSAGARGARPADGAREALRAARRQAKADAASVGGSANSAAPARRSSRSAGGQRRPHGPGSADARARAVREFAAGAFRLPPEADPAEEAPPAGESAGDSATEGPASEARPVARSEPGSSPGADRAAARALRGFAAGAFRVPPEADPAEEAPPAADLSGWPVAEGSDAEDRGAARPEPGSSSGADHTAGAPGADHGAVSAGADHSAVSAGASHAAGADHAAGAPGADHAAGAGGADHTVGGVGVSRVARGASVSSQGGDAARSGGAGADGEGARRSQRQPSAVRGRDVSASAAQPRAPRSMAAPDRDGDLRRTFAALPPREAADEGFAGTWWGNAWVTALEEGALDAARLERGRGYAERGHVDAITVTPGLVLAYVQGSRARPYRVQVRLRTLGDADWDRFLDAAVERPGHIAALLDKELPHSLADLADHGVPLLPGPGDLTPQCSCPDSGHPCKHAAALCYQTARLLDADPFVLLLLRGRGERALLDALSRRNATRAARAAQDRGPAPLPGVRAGEALTPRALPPLPPPLPAPPHPEQPPAYPAAPGGPDPFALDQLATDAAARAHALLTTGRDPVGGLTLWQDAVRLAAARPGSGLTAGTRALYASLASAAGRDTAELARAVAAWRQGGPEGLDVLEEPWDPPAGRFDRARPLLLAADLPAFRPWRNRLTHPRGHVQLRLGRAGLWYAYESEPGREDWWPRGTPDLDPVGALTGLGTRVDL